MGGMITTPLSFESYDEHAIGFGDGRISHGFPVIAGTESGAFPTGASNAGQWPLLLVSSIAWRCCLAQPLLERSEPDVPGTLVAGVLE